MRQEGGGFGYHGATSLLLQLARGGVHHGLRWRPGCWPGGKAQQSESVADELQLEALGLEARSSWGGERAQRAGRRSTLAGVEPRERGRRGRESWPTATGFLQARGERRRESMEANGVSATGWRGAAWGLSPRMRVWPGPWGLSPRVRVCGCG